MFCKGKHSNQISGDGRVLSLEERKALKGGEVVYIQSERCPHFLRVKVNGKARVWKRNPQRVEIPFKYGLYEYGVLTEKDVIKVEA